MTGSTDATPPEDAGSRKGADAGASDEGYTPFGARFDEDYSGSPNLDPTVQDIDATMPDPGDDATLHITSGTEPENQEGFPSIPGVTLKALIGQGGQGQVYRGYQTYVDRQVAVKVLAQGADTSFADRFRREAKLLAGMQHPFVVSCYSAGVTDDGHGFITMEFIDGPDLAGFLRKNGALAPCDALGIVRDMAQALEYALTLGVIHRDVKPQNVLLQPKDMVGEPGLAYRPKLADLGLARATGESSANTMVTAPGSVMGTPATMALEQIDDPDSVDFRADIYGLGCVLYHALAGQAAYRGLRPSQIFKKKSQEAAPDVRGDAPGVPPRLAKLVRNLMDGDRSRRPQSYSELIEKLEAEITALEEPRHETSIDGTKAKRPVGLLVAGVAAILLGAVWLATSGGDGDGVPDPGSTPPAFPIVDEGPGNSKTPPFGKVPVGPSAEEAEFVQVDGPEGNTPATGTLLAPAIQRGAEVALFGTPSELEDLLQGWHREPPEAWGANDAKLDEPLADILDGPARASHALPDGAWRLTGEVRVRRPFGQLDSTVRGGWTLGFTGGQELEFTLVLGPDEKGQRRVTGDLEWVPDGDVSALKGLGPGTFSRNDWVPFCIESEGSVLRLGSELETLQVFEREALGLRGPASVVTLVGQGVVTWRKFVLRGL